MEHVLLFVHVSAVIVWLGGVAAVTVLAAALMARRDHAGMLSLFRVSRTLGMFVLGPASVLTLIAGMALAARLRLGMQAWTTWGLVAIAVSVVLGAVFIRRAADGMGRALEGPASDAAAVPAERRFVLLYALNLLILFSAVAAMVFKPGA